MAIKIAGTEVINDNKRVLNNESLPDVRPSLLLDFANSKTLDPRITFTRGSTATYWDGKTTTKAEENLLRYSQYITGIGGYWVPLGGFVATPNVATAPDGTTTASQLTLANGTNFYYQAAPYTTGATYTFSVYVKQAPTGSATNFRMATNNTSAWGSGGTASIALTSSWQRLTLTGTLSAGSFAMNIHLDGSDASGGFDAGSAGNVLIWGAQLEIRDSATAYTATTTSPIVKYQPTLQTAASGEARFDHDPVTGESKGLLIEEARTNLATYSEAFNSWTKLEATVESNVAVAPDGTLTADKIVPSTTSTAAHRVSIPQGFTLGTSYAFSVYAKAGEKQYIDVRWYDGNTNAARIVFDVSNGTVTTTYAGTGVVEDVGNGWYRCAVYASATNTSISGFALIYVEDADTGGVTYSGNGYDGLYLWGAQFEVGAFPTSYIPTSGSTVTRSLDSAEITGTSFDFFNNQESTFYAELDMTYSGDNSKGILSVNTDISGASGRLINMYLSSGLQYYYDSYSFGTTVASGSGGSAPPSKISLGFSTTSYLATSDEQLVGNTSGSYYLDEAVSMKIGGTYNGNSYPLNGHLKKIACYPKQLTSATLQAMTEA